MSESNIALLLELLADGAYHSGQALGDALGMSRAAVWKRLQSLAQYGIVVESIKGVGYRIPGGLSPLNAGHIRAGVSDLAQPYIGRLSCFELIDSTNEFLLKEQSQSGDVCLAEQQSTGRGRRGRSWFSPYGKNLYMSVCWYFDQGVSVLDGLSLVVGVLLVESLAELGVSGVRLKWPNDLLVKAEGDNTFVKLGGGLIEVGGDLTGDCKVVIGVGLNVAMSEAVPVGEREKITQPWGDLRREGYAGGRDELVAMFLSKLLPALNNYQEQGFSEYKSRWERVAAYRGESVSIHLQGRVESGVMLGVSESGALLIQKGGDIEVFNGGEVSLRGAANDH